MAATASVRISLTPGDATTDKATPNGKMMAAPEPPNGKTPMMQTSRQKFLRSLATVLVLAAVAAPARLAEADGPPTTAPAPRSAHYLTLFYTLPAPAKDGVVEFYNECVVRQEVKGSYFCAAGFAGGYFGIQDRPDKKVGICSVWDHASRKVNDPKVVPLEQQTRTLSVGDGVRQGRFGNEGTGGHTDFDCDWVVGRTYDFDWRSTIKGASTEYQGWFRDPASGQGWKHIATFLAPDGGLKMKRIYSFLEDFRRDGKSATEIRRGEFGNGWVKATADGPWLPLLQARLAENKGPHADPANFDAGVVGDRFYLQNGLGTAATIAIGGTMTLPETYHPTPPSGVPTTSPSTTQP
jgi:hypothetical protein